jgi:hypothetical protein
MAVRLNFRATACNRSFICHSKTAAALDDLAQTAQDFVQDCRNRFPMSETAKLADAFKKIEDISISYDASKLRPYDLDSQRVELPVSSARDLFGAQLTVDQVVKAIMEDVPGGQQALQGMSSWGKLQEAQKRTRPLVSALHQALGRAREKESHNEAANRFVRRVANGRRMLALA